MFPLNISRFVASDAYSIYYIHDNSAKPEGWAGNDRGGYGKEILQAIDAPMCHHSSHRAHVSRLRAIAHHSAPRTRVSP